MKRNIFQTIGSAAEKALLNRINNNTLFAEYYKRGDKAKWKRQSTMYERKEIKDWTMAVMAATDPENPRRGQLMRFYQGLRIDPHLSSVMDTRILRVQRSSYKIVNDNGDENEELKALLERPWHDDLIRLTVGKTFQGTTLIELFDTDETNELQRVNEIPQSNFLPQKGVIINEEWDDIGTSYRDGRYSDFYVQVGSDWELGMLNELGMIVLAKKLGLGSWMGYIEKFGVPPLFAITERMDTGRRDELFEMLENFKMNHFAVLQGNEKIEVPNNYNVDAYNSFKSLINDVCNQEISKRVLGGTAIVDVKSFVGSAEVQERVAQDRYEADKLLYKHYFNTQYRQRLVKLSSVYSEFATHRLIWDNQETLDINGYIDAVQKLSTTFDFDIEEVRNRTGLPIIGTKTPNSATGIPNSGIKEDKTDPQKKKTNANLKGLVPQAHVQPNFVIFAATWDAAIERLADQIYNGEVKPTDLDKDLVLKNYAALNKKAETTWGKGYYNETVTRQFRENLMNFASAKAFNLMSELDDLKGKTATKEQFIQEAKKKVNLHNSTYLSTEENYVANAVIGARNYQDHFKDEDILPNLKYMTLDDDQVRYEHKLLDGVIKPLRDPFWNTYYPPNGWRCRCFVQQTDEEPTGQVKKIDILNDFENNPGKTGRFFAHKNSYRKNITEKDWKKAHKNGQNFKEYTPYNNNIKVGDNKIFVSDFADASDLNANIIASKKIIHHLKVDVYIRHNVNSTEKIKNPEIGLKKRVNLADLKTFNPKKSKDTRSFVKNGINSAADQLTETVIFDLTQVKENDFLVKAADKLHGEFKNNGKAAIKQVIIIHNDKVLSVSRKNIEKKNYIDFFKFE